MTNDRLAIVKYAFKHLSNGKSELCVNWLIDNYNAKNHPRVLSREKNADVVHKDFANYISEKAVNGKVSEEGFISYYTDLNAVLPAERDSYFIDIVNKTWGL